ncbi:MAG: SLC13 family permease, partial [Bacteroidetes bacterium]|nr:SLC13 family permease [Candidatus Enterocola intestinipullorum]
IGTPPNLIISDTLAGAGYGSLEFFSFLPVGLICLATGMLFLIPASKLVLGKKKRQGNDSEDKETLSALVNEYGITDNLFRIKASASIDGKTIAELDIRNKYSLNVVEIRRERKGQHRFFKTVQQELATAGTRINPNDILYLSGNFEDVGRFAKDYGCDILDKHSIEENEGNRDKLDFYDVGVAEILILPSSDLTNDSVKTIGFREKFNLNILGIKRKKGYILKDLGNVKLQENDVLLVQGKWQDIARLDNENNEWVVLGQPLEQASKVTLDYKAPIAAAILIMMVVLMVLDLPAIKPVTAVLIASILMVVTGCVRNMEAAYKTINWETIVLFAAMLPMSTALEKTGVSDLISGSLAGGLGDFGPVALLAGIYFTTSLMTIFISNTVTAVLMAPIALHSAEAMGLSPVPFLFAVTVAASMCFASPFSTPPNAMVMHPGQYSFMDFIKVGLPLQVIMGIVMVLVLPLIFPF